MKLLIVESPAKAKTIEKYLKGEYKVKASVGHIRDLPKSNKQAIDIDGGFVPKYVVSKGKEKVVSELRSLAAEAEDVVLATDPDREGEAIAWHITEACNLKNAKRIVFNEITETAVSEAIKNPRKIDTELRKAQEARRVLDRLFGYDLSELIWKKVRYGLSAGRVQSPALRIIMEREREIRAFIPEHFWVITALLGESKDKSILFTGTEEPKSQEDADKILASGRAGKWHIKSIKETEASRAPKPPFTTSTLQQTASTRLGFAPSRTMMIAQRLYEAGHITYMRTDSPMLSKDAEAAIDQYVTKKYGTNYTQPRAYKTKSKTAQEAHEAIRPTNINKPEAGASPEQKKLYKLIWARAIASQMSDAKMLRTRVIANIEGDALPDFAANGSRLTFDGWLAADPDSRADDVEIPKLSEGQEVVLFDMNAEGKQTEPPARYTEAGLVKELEKRGLGRPSTYAAIIKTLQDRGYVTKEGRTLFPTDTGEVVSDFLEAHFSRYISDEFTSHMEDELDDIANGKREYTETLEQFYKPFTKEVKSKKNIEKLTTLGPADPQWKCPKCGGEMVIKLGKGGKFLSCARFPDCEGARTIEGAELAGPKETGEMCPDCGNPLVEREGRFGKFVSCSKYPKCKFIKKSAEEEEKAKTGVKCPVCKDGELVARRGRFGEFFSCSNYPKCKYAIKARPTGNLCSMCGSLMMEGTKTIPERCSDKTCPNHNPHKLEKAK